MGARYARDANPPDFKLEKNLTPFRGVPIFIFHGEKDMNVPIGDTRALAERLKQKGALVEFCVDRQRGHGSPGAEGLTAFKNWVKTLPSKAR
jgi:predicted esterase